MEEKVNAIKSSALEEIEKANDLQSLEDARVKYLGKKGELTAILKMMGTLSPEERPKLGSIVNVAKNELTAVIDEKEEKLKKEELAKKLESEKIDVTLPSSKIIRGSKHPLNRVIEEIEDLFVSMGYDVVSGPELETDEYCFERLNLPKVTLQEICKIVSIFHQNTY